ncbi:MAG: cytochrome ubiquinol oxidase subunit I [Anaerolineae bacterium]
MNRWAQGPAADRRRGTFGPTNDQRPATSARPGPSQRVRRSAACPEHSRRVVGRRAKHASVAIAAGCLVLLLLVVTAAPALAQGGPPALPEYREFPVIGSRVAIWIVAELMLLFAAFVLGVPIFAVIIEAIGVFSKDPRDKVRYDRLACDFIKLLPVAFSATAILGGLMLFLLIGLYPGFTGYYSDVFWPTMIVFALLFFGEAGTFYLYYSGWDAMQNRKGLHLALGVLLNVFGTALMFIGNGWATFMMSPAGVNEAGALVASSWTALANPLWWPLNIHRLIANSAFGGFVAAAYAAYQFLNAKTDEDQAHYDWMGYVGNFVGVLFLIPLPFAGYWFGRELYEASEQMGLTLMGGIFSWLFIIQAVLVGVLFIGANYYLWLGMGRAPGGERYDKYRLWMEILIVICLAIWLTPHSLVASLEEARKLGGRAHPLLGVLGVMSAKNTVVNVVILTTFLNFLFYRRANKIVTVSWERIGKIAQMVILGLAAVVVIFYGVYGYFVTAITRIGFSVYQVSAVLGAMLLCLLIDIPLFRGARTIGKMQWGKMPARAQYTLILMAVAAVWLMGLMGYARSGARLHWHVWGVLRDTSPGAFTPTLGYATNVVSLIVVLFFALTVFIFWIAQLGERREPASHAPPLPEADPVRANPGSPVEEA